MYWVVLVIVFGEGVVDGFVWCVDMGFLIILWDFICSLSFDISLFFVFLLFYFIFFVGIFFRSNGLFLGLLWIGLFRIIFFDLNIFWVIVVLFFLVLFLLFLGVVWVRVIFVEVWCLIGFFWEVLGVLDRCLWVGVVVGMILVLGVVGVFEWDCEFEFDLLFMCLVLEVDWERVVLGVLEEEVCFFFLFKDLWVLWGIFFWIFLILRLVDIFCMGIVIVIDFLFKFFLILLFIFDFFLFLGFGDGFVVDCVLKFEGLFLRILVGVIEMCWGDVGDGWVCIWGVCRVEGCDGEVFMGRGWEVGGVGKWIGVFWFGFEMVIFFIVWFKLGDLVWFYVWMLIFNNCMFFKVNNLLFFDYCLVLLDFWNF